ncbi:MAG: histidine--tRNA ligase [Alphaproteobacteria bacterium]|nr:histidine--tRNA ligase [Alphaproteobacteria bacterium]MBQ7127785.1 histidine--tRNA ligase [Alphaproteobacteria bacterium]
MDLKPTKPLSGFIELLPAQQRCFDFCAARMLDVLKTSGFNMLDLPAIERAEVLTDKDNWDEIETQMFLFQKGDTKMGLRYDGTVGLSRYVAGHLNDLTFPFRASQFSKRYRGERAQRGRYREFYQMDMDIMGVNSLSTNYDAEIISVIQRTLNSVSEFIGENAVRVGSRPFWDALFDYLEMNDNQKKDVFVLIDKKDKMGDADFAEGLRDTLNNENKENQIKSVFTNGYFDFLNKSDKLDAAISELNEFMKTLELFGVKNAEIDLSITRGLAYYTGLVFEFKLLNHPELGTAAGGGRYADLAGKFSKTKIIGVGAAIGFSRIFVALMESGAIDLTQFESPVDVAVLCMGNENLSYAVSVLNAMRDAKIPAVAYLDAEKKFKNQIEYADKIKTKFSAIIGESEKENQVVALKNMTTGEQQSLPVADAIKTVLGA